MNPKISFVLLSGLCIGWLAGARAQEAPVVATSFESGQTAPDGWTSSDSSATAWEKEGHSGNRSISVSATKPGQSVYWRWNGAPLNPGKLYRLSFWAKGGVGSNGRIVSGLSDVNHDFAFSAQWKQYSFVFQAPRNPGYLRLGQWNATGKVLFDDVHLEPCTPIYTGQGGQELGEGEEIKNGIYSFKAPLTQSNSARPLQENNAAFNSYRWVFGNDTSLVYFHRIGTHLQKNATVTANINYYKSGKLIIEVSLDGKRWTEIASLDHLGEISADIPASFFPAPAIQVRLRAQQTVTRSGDSAPGAFQINNYTYTAALADKVADAKGATLLALQKPDPQYDVKVLSLGSLLPGHSALQTQIRAPQRAPLTARLTARLTLQQPQGKPLIFENSVDGNGAITLLPYQFTSAGDWQATLQVLQNKKVVYAASTHFFVNIFYASDYGQRISGTDDLWWSNSSYKIAQNRPLPAAADKSTFVPVSLARNEYEAVQIIARPQKDVTGVTVQATDLTGPNGAKISNSHITIDEVAYVPVERPTDSTGAVGNWPDPLPPASAPINLKAHQNQPFWITVYAPKDIPAGIYTGKVLLSGNGWKRDVPLHVTVWNFTLSDTPHLKSALGILPARIAPYYRVSDEQLQQLMAKYYTNFSAHRLSPYNPIYGHSIKVNWGLEEPTQWQGGKKEETNPFEGKRSLHVHDASTTSNVSAAWNQQIPIKSGQKYSLQFAARTATAGQGYQVTIATYDAQSKWIPRNNIDLKLTGNGNWQEISEDITKRLADPRMHFVTVTLRATRWTSNGAGIGDTWFDNVQLIENEATDLLHGGGDFEESTFKVTPQQVNIDFSDFDKAMENAMAKYHLTTFLLNIQGVGHRSGGPNGYTPGRIGNFVQGSPEYNTLFGSYVKQVQDHLEKKGWLDKAYLYWIDEPGPGIYKKIAEMGDIIHRYAPKLKWMLTEQPEPELIHSVDIFNPLLNRYDHKTALDLQSKGKEIWWYICTIPKAPYVGEFIDRAGIEPRLWLWQTWKNKVQGILIWETVYWTRTGKNLDSLQNPWQDAMSWSRSGGPWGNGDGRFLYPPRRDPNTDKTPNTDAPINSIRWEALRDGMEDYEYFWTLQQQVDQLEQKKNLTDKEKTWLASAKVLLQVPDSISKSLTEFSKAPTPLLKRRAEIATAIEAGKSLIH